MPDFRKQIGIIGEYEPELCAVTGKSVRGKHAVTFYKGDGVHYVRVLNNAVEDWKQAAPHYGFPEPVIEEERERQDEIFVLGDNETQAEPQPIAAEKVVIPSVLSPMVPAARPNKKESDS